MDVSFITDIDFYMLKKYWADVIMIETKKRLAPEAFNNEEIDELYYQFDQYEQFIHLEKDSFSQESFNTFFSAMKKARSEFENSMDARSIYIDFRLGFCENRNIMVDYENDKLLNSILNIGVYEKLLNKKYEPINHEDFLSYCEVLFIWWDRVIGFLRDNYGKSSA